MPATDKRYKPTSITLNRQLRQLIITWVDDHTTALPFDDLRAACPCAVCKEERSQTVSPVDTNMIELTPVKTLDIKTLQQVGGYALQPTWNDGHTAGFYPWEYLRGICPCSDCDIVRAELTNE